MSVFAELPASERIREIRPEREHRRVREVDHAQDREHQRIAERKQREHTADGQPVQGLLQEQCGVHCYWISST